MRNDHYPHGTVQGLLLTEIVSKNTKIALQNRLKKSHVITPRFFDSEIFLILRAISLRLVPQTEKERIIDLAGSLDDMLFEGKGKGWRYDSMPAIDKVFIIGLNGIEQTSISNYNRSFNLLSSKEQDELLNMIQEGGVTNKPWDIISPKLFFEELLAALVEIYYSHPFAKEDIGEVAMADAYGWQKIGLNQLEAHEPVTLNNLYVNP